jgi:hypothetical protein
MNRKESDYVKIKLKWRSLDLVDYCYGTRLCDTQKLSNPRLAELKEDGEILII